MADTGRTTTYRELDEASNQLAHVFRARGLQPGDHIAVLLENHPRFLEVTWAAQRSGLVYTTINYHLTPDEAAYIARDSGARALVTSVSHAESAAALLDAAPGIGTRLMIDGAVDAFEPLEPLTDAQPTVPIDDEVEGGDMLYSSGTTGRPKGIRPRTALKPIGTAPALVSLLENQFGFGPGVRYLSTAPLYHAGPLRYAMSVQRLGGTVVVMPHFDALTALRDIETYGITHSQWVPTMFIRLLRLTDEERARHDLSTHRYAIHSAAPCPPDVKERMIEWWGPIVYEYYSGTEGNCFVCIDSTEWLEHRGSVGRAVLGELHVVDDEGNDVPTGEIGGIYVAHGARFEYHNDPEKTAASRNDRGWSTLGDVGYLDADGYLYLTDRRAHTIISGGVNIYPKEIEDVLIGHPAVDDVAVFGLPNPEFGEEVKVVVQPRAPYEASPELETELIAYCREHLAGFKCPRSVDFDAQLPRLPTGKLAKHVLQSRYAREGSRA
jgi:acyl-CoA synthetase (AMP-forming)/AMP-acid ligase II